MDSIDFWAARVRQLENAIDREQKKIMSGKHPFLVSCPLHSLKIAVTACLFGLDCEECCDYIDPCKDKGDMALHRGDLSLGSTKQVLIPFLGIHLTTWQAILMSLRQHFERECARRSGLALVLCILLHTEGRCFCSADACPPRG